MRFTQQQMIEHYTEQGGRLLRSDRMRAEVELCGAVAVIDGFGCVHWEEIKSPTLETPGREMRDNQQKETT